MRRDKCGICGGDGSTCRVVSGNYNERGSFGYNEILKIPAGSANIDITQRGYRNQKEDDNYLGQLTSNCLSNNIHKNKLNSWLLQRFI